MLSRYSLCVLRVLCVLENLVDKTDSYSECQGIFVSIKTSDVSDTEVTEARSVCFSFTETHQCVNG